MDHKDFVKENIEKLHNDTEFKKRSTEWIMDSVRFNYSYNFSWLGRPIIQYPQDMVALQEVIWSVKPDLVIETGIAHGGSLILSASILALVDICDTDNCNDGYRMQDSSRKVLGVDIDIREHNRDAIARHPLSAMIQTIDGSSIDSRVVKEIRDIAKDFNNVLVILDSNHTHEHVLEELNAYADLVSRKSYCIVMDTVIETMEGYELPDRPWGKGNNPMTAVQVFLDNHPEFVIDRSMDSKLSISAAPMGYLIKTR